jgi:uncharacterized protein YlaN (UPF0358 family)
MAKKIGEYFIDLELMNDAQVATILRTQNLGDKSMFGVLAIKLGYITEEDLKGYVSHLEGEITKIDGAIPKV